LRALDAQPAHEQLTAREAEVLRHLLAGQALDAIARQMGLSEKTISNYQTLVRQKLGVGSAHELLRYAREHGLIG
ncbi:MAG TPA: LuxR C-terminal-related transcriptional regulator, partial [Burkholderiaceae bacterium]|nr:LuxR C-terminal-related transcriptional regulator [Burkholderiaceae bacterium]